MNLFNMGIITINPELFINQLNDSINVGVAGLCPISSIKKRLIRKTEISLLFLWRIHVITLGTSLYLMDVPTIEA